MSTPPPNQKLKPEHPAVIARRINKRFAKIGGGEDLIIPEREPLSDPITFDE